MKKAIGIIAPLAVVAGLIWLVWFKPPKAEESTALNPKTFHSP